MLTKITILIIFIFVKTEAVQRRNNSISTDEAIQGLLTVYNNISNTKFDGNFNETMVGKIDLFVGGMKNSVKNISNSVQSKFEDVVDNVNGTFKNISTSIQSKFVDVVDNINGTISNVSNSVQSKFNNIKKTIFGASNTTTLQSESITTNSNTTTSKLEAAESYPELTTVQGPKLD